MQNNISTHAKVLFIGFLFGAASVMSLWNITKCDMDYHIEKNNINHKRLHDPSTKAQLCTNNQYAKSLSMSLADYESHMNKWLENVTINEHQLLQRSTSLNDFTIPHDHSRFDAFEIMGSCNITCLGGICNSDLAKATCGVNDGSMEAPCVVYSIGSNNKWDFELDVLGHTPCEVYTFDCTGDATRFQPPNNTRLHFHHICLGAKNKKDKTGEFMTLSSMTEMLQHQKVDLLKLDIEGYEWPLFSSWPTLAEMDSTKTILPMQILVEVHYRSKFKELVFSKKVDFKFPTDMIQMQEHILKMGYAVVARDDNAACNHCTELTLIRIKCPMLS